PDGARSTSLDTSAPRRLISGVSAMGARWRAPTIHSGAAFAASTSPSNPSKRLSFSACHFTLLRRHLRLGPPTGLFRSTVEYEHSDERQHDDEANQGVPQIFNEHQGHLEPNAGQIAETVPDINVEAIGSRVPNGL